MNYSGNVITKNPVQPSLTSAPGVWSLQEAQNAVANGTWPIPGVINPISKSLRFNSADSAYLNRTPAVASNRKTWTWSAWVKRSVLSTLQSLQTVQDGVTEDSIAFTSPDILRVYLSPVGGDGTVTTAVFRDPSAWYHIVVAVDTTQATAANRTIIYVNGVNATSSSSNYVTQNSDTKFNGVLPHYLGRYANQTMPTGNFNGYITEFNFIDGQALTPSAFGLTDPNTGVWVPKKYTGTYGTNGFYLNFSDSNSTTLLGYDYSGNGNNWTPNNFSVTAGAGNDSLTDVPTLWTPYTVTSDTGGVVRGNYCTMNPLTTTAGTYTQGNLRYVGAGGWRRSSATIPLTTGKWYWEVTLGNSPYTPRASSTAYNAMGFCLSSTFNSTEPFTVQADALLLADNGYYKNFSGSATDTGTAFSSGDVLAIAVNLDANTFTFYRNNSSIASGTIGGTAGRELTPCILSYDGSYGVMDCNFGQRPFAYTPPTGFKSLCTTNLPTPTIGAASTTLAGNYFNAVTYTGTGSALGVTGVGFQPDFVWIKSRSAATDHALYDAVRGVQKQLESNTTTAETTETQGLTAFDTNGFNLGTLAQLNTVNATYVGWNWNAGGSNATNTSGTITSTVRANTTAGFSIVTWSAQSTAGTVGHGLGVAPSMIIIKERGASGPWFVYHASVGAGKYLLLNTTDASATNSTVFSTTPTSTVFNPGTGFTTGSGYGSMLTYCFAPVAGYSAFGSYTGNGSTDGPFVYTGFRPAYVLVKRTDAAYSWWIEDAKRNPYNVTGNDLATNLSDAEYNDSPVFDFVSNGFKLRTSTWMGFNANGGTYIYAAFAENPFKFANAR